MKWIVYVCRLLVGSLFIVSGLIKANDPLGFSYKLEEYFSPEVLNWSWFESMTLEIAVLICISEIVLGFAALFGAKMRIVSWSLLLMILFFTFLTFYSAYYDKVTDCGCFGDALKLTPWESFTKDVVLLVLVFVIFIWQRRTEPNTFKEDMITIPISLALITWFCLGVLNNPWALPIYFSIGGFVLLLVTKKIVNNSWQEWVMGIIVVIISGYFSAYALNHLPHKDFRPYAIGKSISEGMVMPEGEQPPVYVVYYTMKNKATGEEKQVNSNEYISSGIWADENWEITETSEPVKIKDGYEPPIHDFSLMDPDGSDITESVLEEPVIFLLISKDITTCNKEIQEQVNAFANEVFNNGYYIYGVTSSLYEDLEDFRHENQNQFDYLSADHITLKTIIRSNPGLLMLKQGTVTGKWHYNDFPTFEQVQKEYLSN